MEARGRSPGQAGSRLHFPSRSYEVAKCSLDELERDLSTVAVFQLSKREIKGEMSSCT